MPVRVCECMCVCVCVGVCVWVSEAGGGDERRETGIERAGETVKETT